MEEIRKEIGHFCLLSSYKHFIIMSLEESIEIREEEIGLIRKGKMNGDILDPERANMIDSHISMKEELTKLRNSINSIPNCPN